MAIGIPAQPSALAVFRNRNFTLLWVAQFVSTIGGGLTSLAASILVYRVTGSALSVGLMLMATALPNVLIGLFAGVFVDRSDRKRVMLVADLLRALLVMLIPLLLPFGIAWLYVLVALASTLERFFAPAQASVLPETATDQELAAANSLMTISETGALTIGFTFAGLLASQLPLEWAFYIDAATFGLSALCIAFLQVAPLPVDEKTSVRLVMRNLRAGIDVIRTTPLLRALFVVFVPIFVLFGFENALFLPFTTRALHATEFEYSLLEGVSAVGFIAGGLLMLKLADRLHAGQWMVISILGLGLITAIFAFAPTIQIAIGLTLISGLFNAPAFIGRKITIQRNTPRAVRGRVNSAFSVARDVVYLLGMAAAGLADLFDTRALLLVEAVLLLGCGALLLLMPGLGQPSAEWRQMLRMLRTVPSAPGLGSAATLADIDTLARCLPSFASLSSTARQQLARQTRVYDLPTGTAIVRQNEASDAAYVLLHGRTVAVRAADEGPERVLEVHNAGDFFGEIAALMHFPRTATVLTEQPSRLLQIPATTLRQLMRDQQLNRLFLNRMTERMVRMDMVELPRFASADEAALRELRTPE